MTSPAIETENLRKEFGSKVAVADLTLRVEQGEIFGFLGPNGAGKTTSIKMLLGLTQPTSGNGFLLGQPLGDPATRSRVGFLPEHFRFHEWLTAAEFLNLHGRLYGMSAAARAEAIPDLLELVGLGERAETRLAAFSKGMLQRIGLAQALLNNPGLVFLDEPTSGLDPLGRRLVRTIVAGLREEGTTVFLNSHLLSEIEVTCDRVGFVRRGRLVHCGPLSELLAAATEVEITLDPGTELTAADLASLPHEAVVVGERLLFRLSDESLVPDLVARLVALGVRIRSVRPQRSSLEEVFLELMEGEGAG